MNKCNHYLLPYCYFVSLAVFGICQITKDTDVLVFTSILIYFRCFLSCQRTSLEEHILSSQYNAASNHSQATKWWMYSPYSGWAGPECFPGHLMPTLAYKSPPPHLATLSWLDTDGAPGHWVTGTFQTSPLSPKNAPKRTTKSTI